MLKKVFGCLVVATAITPAAVSPAVAGCCGAFPVAGSTTLTQQVYGPGLTTMDTVTNTSMQMTVTEDATFTPANYAPELTSPDNGNGGETCGEVM
jgi:hypothetical protein